MRSILFTHKAVGKSGKEFTVYKIRTMIGDISSDRDAKLSLSGLLDETDAKRLTLLGRILRPIGLDEVPQIYNILILRNMQLIGIRPFLIEEFELLPEEVQQKLMRQKPGFIPAEAHYLYTTGDLNSRVEAIEMYLQENPRGVRKMLIGLSSLVKRWSRYSVR